MGRSRKLGPRILADSLKDAIPEENAAFLISPREKYFYEIEWRLGLRARRCGERRWAPEVFLGLAPGQARV
jgi:hypothetical protein